jgi:hypothetical protein
MKPAHESQYAAHDEGILALHHVSLSSRPYDGIALKPLPACCSVPDRIRHRGLLAVVRWRGFGTRSTKKSGRLSSRDEGFEAVLMRGVWQKPCSNRRGRRQGRHRHINGRARNRATLSVTGILAKIYPGLFWPPPPAWRASVSDSYLYPFSLCRPSHTPCPRTRHRAALRVSP